MSSSQEESGEVALKQCKLFIGGLNVGSSAGSPNMGGMNVVGLLQAEEDSGGTTNDSMRSYFERYGEVYDAVVMRDGATQKSRGFGFLTFADVSQADACLEDHPHTLDGKQVEVKKAVPKDDGRAVVYSSQRSDKVFLGGLSLDCEKEDIMDALADIGRPAEITIMTDKITDKPRGFGFARFETCDEAEKVCKKKTFVIRGREVEAKKAQSQDSMHRSGGRGGRGGRGGGGGDMERSYQGANDYGRGGGADSYAARSAAYYAKMGYGEYPYMRGGDYGGGYAAAGYGERTAAAAAAAASYYQNYGRYPQGYDMAAYASMYGQSGGMSMGTYNQSSSGYGPSRGSYSSGGGGGDAGDRDRQGGGGGGGRGSAGYHPYRR